MAVFENSNAQDLRAVRYSSYYFELSNAESSADFDFVGVD